MAMRVWANYGINVILYGRNEVNIPSAWKELPDLDHPLGGSFISLGDELKSLEETKKLVGEKWIESIKELVVEKRNIPRLTNPIDGFSGKNYICSLISDLNETSDKEYFSEQNIAKIVDYLKLLAISIALDHVIIYMRRAASAWQDKMAGAGNGYKDSDKVLSENYGCTSITQQIRNRVEDSTYAGGQRFKEIWRQVKRGKVTALHLSRGRGKGTFATFLRLHCKKRNINSRFISLDRTMRVRTVLTDVIDRMDKFELICIQNADFLLDSSTKSAKTISMQKFIERLNAKFDADGNYKNKKVLLIFRSESAARSVCENRNNFDLLPPKGATPLLIHRESMLCEDVDHKEHMHLHDVLRRHHWPNILLSGLLDELCGTRDRLGSRSPLLEQINSKRKSFINSCEQSIRKRTFGTNEKFEQAIFCDAILEESHIFVQNSDGEEHRIMHVIQNIII
ncbi:MAG: hypothetical protein HC794_09860, partial [Nitrospiraceae bacterium]|nr:hypothetical protein [Nitrospiraceae bacterium]